MTVLFNFFMKQTADDLDDFWGSHKNMNCAFPLQFALFNQGSLTFLVQVRTNLESFDKNWKHSVKSCYQHICLICTSRRTATYLQSVRIMPFLHATTVSLIKLIFYIKNKKGVDLKLPHRISRSKRFSKYLSPETY